MGTIRRQMHGLVHGVVDMNHANFDSLVARHKDHIQTVLYSGKGRPRKDAVRELQVLRLQHTDGEWVLPVCHTERCSKCSEVSTIVQFAFCCGYVPLDLRE